MSRQTLVGVVALGVTTGAVLFACKSNNIADTTNNITNNTYITKEVGAGGAYITGPGGSSVDIQAGALTSSVSFKIGQLVPTQYPSTMPAIPSGWTVAGYVFSFEPHGQAFDIPATITVPYTGGTPSSVNLVTANPSGTWSTVPGAMLSDVTAQVDSMHFSYYAVVTGAPAAVDAGSGGGRDAAHGVDASKAPPDGGTSVGCPANWTACGSVCCSDALQQTCSDGACTAGGPTCGYMASCLGSCTSSAIAIDGGNQCTGVTTCCAVPECGNGGHCIPAASAECPTPIDGGGACGADLECCSGGA